MASVVFDARSEEEKERRGREERNGCDGTTADFREEILIGFGVRAAESRSSSRLSVEALSLRTHSLSLSLSLSPSFTFPPPPRRTPSSFQGGSLRGRSIRSEVRPRALRRLPQPPSSSVSSDATPVDVTASRVPRALALSSAASSTLVDRMPPSTSCFLPTAGPFLSPPVLLLTC